MRHWITAGFINEKENKTLEEVAEGYLTELVSRSLLQVVKRNHTGRLKCCQVHDIIRLVALNKAGEECFGKVYDGSGAFSIEHTRRISIQSGNLQRLIESDATHVRAIHVFNRYINNDLLRPILESSNLLLTLDLQGTRFKMLPTEVFNLFNLRYLGLRYTNIESLPEDIGKLQNLEVLDAVNSALSYLPNNIAKLQRLRYLFASYALVGILKDWAIGVFFVPKHEVFCLQMHANLSFPLQRTGTGADPGLGHAQGPGCYSGLYSVTAVSLQCAVFYSR